VIHIRAGGLLIRFHEWREDRRHFREFRRKMEVACLKFGEDVAIVTCEVARQEVWLHTPYDDELPEAVITND
jgi:hypothetical protein